MFDLGIKIVQLRNFYFSSHNIVTTKVIDSTPSNENLVITTHLYFGVIQCKNTAVIGRAKSI